MKIRYVSIIAIILMVCGYFIYSMTPKIKAIHYTYNGIAYKLNDHNFSKKITLRLDGAFNEKTKYFQGNMNINNKDYSPCLLASRTTWKVYPSTNELMGTVLTTGDFKQMSFEVDDPKLYYDITNASKGNDKLIFSIPANSREAAIKIHDNLVKDAVLAIP